MTLQCPYCTMMHQLLFPELLKEYGDRVTFVYKDFPAAEPCVGKPAAVDANCLASQNQDAYWSFVDSVHASQQESMPKGRRNCAWLSSIGSAEGADHKVMQRAFGMREKPERYCDQSFRA